MADPVGAPGGTGPCRVGEGGPYGHLARRGIPEGNTAMFMPALILLLEKAEELKGEPLTEAEVLRIRDRALAVVAPSDVVAVTEQQRGYPDVDASHVWESWQQFQSYHRIGPGQL